MSIKEKIVTRKVRKRNKRRRKTLSRLVTLFMGVAVILIGTSLFKLIDNKVLINNNKVNDKSDIIVEGIANEDIVNSKEDEIIDESSKEDTEVTDEIIDDNEDEGISNYLALGEDKYADDAKEIERMIMSWDYLREDGKKVAYLTFDDGPSSSVTEQILDILQENDVKATFFVLGSMLESSDIAQTNLKRMVDEGHAIGNHGYCHNYDILYPGGTANVDNFMSDMNKSQEVMQSILGQDFSTRVLRFPGGHRSWNTEELDWVLEQNNYASIDWNALNGDAEGHNIAAEQLINTLDATVADLYGNDDVLVILMHDIDIKQTTAEYLQSAIDYLKSLGYEFRTLK